MMEDIMYTVVICFTVINVIAIIVAGFSVGYARDMSEFREAAEQAEDDAIALCLDLREKLGNERRRSDMYRAKARSWETLYRAASSR